jgi:hypothetical protein
MHRIRKADFRRYIRTIFEQSNLVIKGGITEDEVVRLIYTKTLGYTANLHYVLAIAEDPEVKSVVSIKAPPSVLCIKYLRAIIGYTLYVAINVMTFLLAYRSVIQKGLPYSAALARSSAFVIKVNCFLIFLPILFIKWVPIFAHQIFGGMIYVMTIVHITGHMIFGLSVYKDGAAITGWIMTLILLINFPYLLFRYKFYDLFYYTHFMLIFLFIPLLCIHAVFTQYFGFPNAWLFVIVPYLFYFQVRYNRYRPKKAVLMDYAIIGNLIKLKFEPVFVHQRGQFVYVNIPQISRLQYHPFSITTGPSEHRIGVIIQKAGDWSSKLLEKIDEVIYANLDGPISSGLQDMVKFRKVILIASGIGITPYISVLKGQLMNVEVHFIFVCREQYFFDLIPSQREQIHYYMYYTGFSNKKYIYGNHISNINDLVFAEYGVDIISGLRTKTMFARPDWASIFEQINSTNICRTGVFFTGSPIISSSIKKVLKMKIFANFYYHEDKF